MWRCPLGLLLLLAGELALGAQRGRGRRELAPALHLRGIRDAGGRYTARSRTCAAAAAPMTAPCPTWVLPVTVTSSATAPSPTAALTSGTSASACHPPFPPSKVGTRRPGVGRFVKPKLSQAQEQG